MKADRHHLGCRLALAYKPVERVDDIIREVGAAKPRGVVELHVIGIEGVGDRQMTLARDDEIVRKIVIVGVTVVKKSTMFDQEPARVQRRRGAGVPAERPLPGSLL